MLMKNLTIFLFITISTFAQKSDLKNGDLLFININCGEMCDAINAVTQGFDSKDFNHMGLVILENKEIFVFEAIGESVTKTPLSTFLKYTKETIYVGRLKNKYKKLIPEALIFCQNNLGVPYDDDFLYDNGKYYCSELIYDAFLHANNEKPFFTLFPMTYKEPHSDSFFPIWIKHFANQGIEIPENEPGCNPGGMSLDKKIILSKYVITN